MPYALCVCFCTQTKTILTCITTLIQEYVVSFANVVTINYNNVVTIRFITIRQFNRNFYQEIKQLPIIVTRKGKALLKVTDNLIEETNQIKPKKPNKPKTPTINKKPTLCKHGSALGLCKHGCV